MTDRVSDRRPARFHLNKRYHVRFSAPDGGHSECIGKYIGDEYSPYDKLLKFEILVGYHVVVAQTDITNAHEADEQCRRDLQRNAGVHSG